MKRSLVLILVCLFTISCGGKHPSQVAQEPQSPSHADAEDEHL